MDTAARILGADLGDPITRIHSNSGVISRIPPMKIVQKRADDAVRNVHVIPVWPLRVEAGTEQVRALRAQGYRVAGASVTHFQVGALRFN